MDNKIKILYKENQDQVTRVNKSGVVSMGIEEEKDSMISCLKENITESETSKEEYGKQVTLQRYENNESSIKL